MYIPTMSHDACCFQLQTASLLLSGLGYVAATQRGGRVNTQMAIYISV